MFTVLIILGTEKYGMDRHIWDVFPTNFEYIALVGWLAEISFIVSTGCTKVSVLLFFRRLTEGSITKVWKVNNIKSQARILDIGLTVHSGQHSAPSLSRSVIAWP